MLYEAQWLQLRRITVTVPGLIDSLRGIRILHISDLHAGTFGPGGRAIDKSLAAARRLDPDLVIFTGDMADKKKELAPLIGPLAEIGARHGKFAVLGNHDHGLRKTVLQDLAHKLLGREPPCRRVSPGSDEAVATITKYRTLLAQAGIELLENECRRVDFGSASIQVCGIDDFQYGLSDLGAAAVQFDMEADLRILLTHSPDAAGSLAGDEYQLILAGHTHGGQICIPRPGGKILLSSSGSDYSDGIYRAGGATMHVSRGVGTTLMPFRLLSRPEITMLELAPGAAATG